MKISPDKHPDKKDRLHPTVRQYVENPAIAELYDSHFAQNLLFQYDCEFIDEYLAADARVLDAGCGTGRHLTHLGAREICAVGLDLSPHFLACAANNLRASGLPQRLIRADLFALPLRATARFDGILLLFSILGLIEGEQNRLDLLRGLRVHLAPDGVLLAHVHNQGYSTPKLMLLREKLRQYLGLSESGDHVMRGYRDLQDLFMHSFTRAEIEKLFTASGYTIQELRPLNQARDGIFKGPNPAANANGFFIAARSSQRDQALAQK